MPTTADVFTEEVTYIATPCPDWCTLSLMHPVDNLTGTDSPDFRIHGGRKFGEFLEVSGAEYVDAPGLVAAEICMLLPEEMEPLSTDRLRMLGLDALAAAQWLEDQA